MQSNVSITEDDSKKNCSALQQIMAKLDHTPFLHFLSRLCYHTKGMDSDKNGTYWEESYRIIILRSFHLWVGEWMCACLHAHKWEEKIYEHHDSLNQVQKTLFGIAGCFSTTVKLLAAKHNHVNAFTKRMKTSFNLEGLTVLHSLCTLTLCFAREFLPTFLKGYP